MKNDKKIIEKYKKEEEKRIKEGVKEEIRKKKN